jgi:hypothetical protein
MLDESRIEKAVAAIEDLQGAVDAIKDADERDAFKEKYADRFDTVNKFKKKLYGDSYDEGNSLWGLVKERKALGDTDDVIDSTVIAYLEDTIAKFRSLAEDATTPSAEAAAEAVADNAQAELDTLEAGSAEDIDEDYAFLAEEPDVKESIITEHFE